MDKPLPIIGAISALITRENGSYVVQILEKSTVIHTEKSKTAPWQSAQIVQRIANKSFPKLNQDSQPNIDRFKAALSETFTKLSQMIEGDPELKLALSNPIVADVIKKTERVVVYPGERTTLEVSIAGKTLSFSSKEIALKDATTLNEKYFNEFFIPLDATRNDWVEIRNYWCEVTNIEKQNTETSIDLLIEKLADFLSSKVHVFSDKNRVNSADLGYFHAADAEVWIFSTTIEDFIKESKSKIQVSELGKELLKRGITTQSVKKRYFPDMPTKNRNCWHFSKEFTKFPIDEAGITNVVDRLDEEPGEAAYVTHA